MGDVLPSIPLCVNATFVSPCSTNSRSLASAVEPAVAAHLIGSNSSTAFPPVGEPVATAKMMQPRDHDWTNTSKFYLGSSIWLGCMFLGVVFAVKMRQLPPSEQPSLYYSHARSISNNQSSQVIQDSKDYNDQLHPSTTFMSPNPYIFLTKHSNVRSSTSSQSVVPASLRNLASLASTTTSNQHHLNHHHPSLIFLSSATSSMTSLGDHRPSRPADMHVPRFVYRESDDISTMSSGAAMMTTTGGTRWHTELQDLSEDMCFESMRTRVSNLTVLDMDPNDPNQLDEGKVAVVV
ncbi:hypothetical protein B5M09_013612 [Aphanomyces astaci]|uniref:Uncharacterized protein n=1 Tax=Aphanomyces astaci TaxID=112090 RepID=A0A3R7Y1A1_APHAT|nr:hypothetical protein B5M09_013612 [Aphanomyces astaci]